MTYGIYEGRDSGTDFNALDYAERYADLKETFGDDVLALYEHYLTYGKTENREARSEEVVEEERTADEDAGKSGTKVFTYSDGSYQVNEYDENGYAVKFYVYSADGILQYYGFIENNSAGNPVKSTAYNADGQCTEWCDYEYDSDGELINSTWHSAS